ncbi:unnamed protein product [Diamesa serratosioi]
MENYNNLMDNEYNALVYGSGNMQQQQQHPMTSIPREVSQNHQMHQMPVNTQQQSDIINLSYHQQCAEYCAGEIRNIFEQYKLYHGYVALIICVFGTIANILNVIVLTRKDMCKTPINSILKWLSLADMVVMIEYIPFSYYMYLVMKDKDDFRYTYAAYLLFHMHFTQILHTISISLTVTLAVWRYIAVKHPHGRLGVMAQTHHRRAVLFSFLVAPIVCLPSFFVFSINELDEDSKVIYHVGANEESALYRVNFWIHSVLIKLLPCFILTIISFVLIDVLCSASKRKIKLKGYNETKTNANGHRISRIDRRTDRTTMLLVAVLLLFLVTEFPQGILGLLSSIMGKCFFNRCYALLGETMDLLALINAAIGFVLYGSMSKQFRSTFKSLFFKKRENKIEMTRITGINTTFTTTNV